MSTLSGPHKQKGEVAFRNSYFQGIRVTVQVEGLITGNIGFAVLPPSACSGFVSKQFRPGDDAVIYSVR